MMMWRTVPWPKEQKCIWNCNTLRRALRMSIVVQHDCAHMVSSDFVECSTATSFDASPHHMYIYMIFFNIYIHL